MNYSNNQELLNKSSHFLLLYCFVNCTETYGEGTEATTKVKRVSSFEILFICSVRSLTLYVPFWTSGKTLCNRNAVVMLWGAFQVLLVSLQQASPQINCVKFHQCHWLSSCLTFLPIPSIYILPYFCIIAARKGCLNTVIVPLSFRFSKFTLTNFLLHYLFGLVKMFCDSSDF